MKATRSTRKVRKKKSEYMSVEAFVDLKTALEDALDFERGEGGNLKVTRIQAPPNAHEQKLGAIIVTKMGQKVYRVFDGS